MSRIENSAKYFNKGYRALFQKHNGVTLSEFWKDMDELYAHAQELNRKEIIQAFDMGFKLGVFWHIEITETKQKIERDYGIEYYRNIYEGGEQ